MYTWNHNSACCLVFAMNIVSHIHVHSCTDQSDNVLLGPVPSTPHCMENMFLGDCKQTDWWHSISLMEEKQGPANCKKLGLIGEVKCHKGCGVLFIDKRHDPLQKMCWQPTSQGDWGGTIATWLQFIATTRAFCLFTFSHISTKSKPEISNECFISPL